jgi:hypothetical protein
VYVTTALAGILQTGIAAWMVRTGKLYRSERGQLGTSANLYVRCQSAQKNLLDARRSEGDYKRRSLSRSVITNIK